MTDLLWQLKNRTRELLDDSGEVLDTLTHDRASDQYRTAAGLLVGRRWDEAREACERRLSKSRAEKA